MIHQTNEGSGMAGDASVLAEHMGGSNDMGVGGNDLLHLAVPFAGVFAVRPDNSSTVKCSLVLCQFTQASG